MLAGSDPCCPVSAKAGWALSRWTRSRAAQSISNRWIYQKRLGFCVSALFFGSNPAYYPHSQP